MKGAIKRSLKGTIKSGIKNAGLETPLSASGVFISGQPIIPNQLTLNYTYHPGTDGAESGSTYRWFRNGTPIGGATSINYTLTNTDANASITAEVTPKSATATGTPVVSGAVGPVTSRPVASSLGYTGTVAIPQTRTLTYSYSNVDTSLESGSTYQWYRADDSGGTNEVPISGATSVSYVYQAEDFQKYVRGSVTPRSANGVSGTQVFGARSQVQDAPTMALVSDTNKLRMIIRDATKFLQYGSTFTIGAFTPIHVTKLTNTKVAVRNGTTGQGLAVFAMNLSTGVWAQEGSTHSFGENFSTPCGIQDNRVVIRFSAAQEFGVYDWNGSAFSLVGSRTAASSSVNLVSARNTNSIWTAANTQTDTLQRWSFDGSTIATVGNATSLGTVTNVVPFQMSNLKTGIYRLDDEVLQAWDYSAPNQVQDGSNTSISATVGTLAVAAAQGTYKFVAKYGGNTEGLLAWQYDDTTNVFSALTGALTGLGADSPFGLCMLQDPGS